MLFSALVALAVTTGANAVAIYGQCGGIGYTGSTTCDAGLSCVHLNDYYYQCLTATTTATSSKTTSSTKGTSSTTSVSKTTTSGTSAPTGITKYWFSFGDSYTQTGFDITSTKPTVNNTFGNPAYPGYTACGSYVNWIDVVATTYAGSTPLEVYNHAYGGATIDATLVAPYTPTVLSLTDQVNSFLANEGTFPSYAPWTGATSFFSFFIGINDIGNSYYLSGDRSAFSDTLLNAYFALVQKIYNVGGRKFLFILVPPVDRSPLMVSQGTSATTLEASVIATFNQKLVAKAASFAANNAGASTWTYDSNAKVTQILNNPTAYGLVDATSYGDVVKDAWCNNYHISPPVHTLLAADIQTILKTAGFLTS